MSSISDSNLEQITKELYKKNLELVNANKEMALLQKMYEIMMETYSLEELSQEYIDTIVSDLGFVAGLVVIQTPLKGHLQAIAVSKSSETDKSLALISKPLATMQVSLHNKNNSLVNSFHARMTLTVTHLESILDSVVTKDLSDKIADIIGIKTTMVFPIKFGKKIFGVYTISFRRPPEDISTQEKEILHRVSILFGVAIDRVMIHRALKTANDKLKELDKLKDEFLSVAAHELRAPLTAVKGYLSMINDGDAGEVNQTVKSFLDGAMSGAEREIRLVNNLLNVSRIEEGRLVYSMGVVSLTKVISTVFDEFKVDAQAKGLDLKVVIPKTIKDRVYVDEDRIHEVVANFISNAVKYTDKGSITVKVEQVVKDTKEKIKVSVSDTGYGISPDECSKLFQKFYRTESAAGRALGTGLGLYITKLLIDKFGGIFGVNSVVGEGSTFWFELPVSKE